MNPNCISHRMFAAALSQAGQPIAKRAARAAGKDASKATPGNVPRVTPSVGAAAQKLSAWSWSGWQHTTI
jgi:hypothetical protein